MKVTSADVARRAGVSQSAVSRVFTPGASVSQQMRERVLAAAKDLGYRPNVLARSLTTGRSKIIGLIVAYLNNQYYPDAIEKLCTLLQERGYRVLIFLVSHTPTELDRVLSEILDYQVDGIVIASVPISSSLASRCALAGVPVVLFNRVQEGPFSTVASDNTAGGRIVADFLARGGHRRIAYLAGWDQASTQQEREAGFRDGLKRSGLRLFARAGGNYDFELARSATRELFCGSAKPDAIFIANDHMAIAAMDVLRFELGLRVPHDVSVVAYDDVPQAAWPSYDLTTVSQPTEIMVAGVVEALIAHIEQGDLRSRRIRLEATLIVRGSARVPTDWPTSGR